MSKESKLFDYANLDVVDDWSRQSYDKLKDWKLARTSRQWSTWEKTYSGGDRYLLVELVSERDGERSEPAYVYSADQELTFATRMWHDHSPHWDFPETEADAYIIKTAERWFAGEFFIAVYYEGEAWKGSITILSSADTRHELRQGLKWVRKNFSADRVELRGPYKSADRVYTIGASGIQFDND